MLALELVADGGGDVRHLLSEREQDVIERDDPGEVAPLVDDGEAPNAMLSHQHHGTDVEKEIPGWT